MNILNFTGFRSKDRVTDDDPQVRVGTPEEPVYVPASRAALSTTAAIKSGVVHLVKTGQDARRSETDRVTSLHRRGLLDRDTIDPDLLLPNPTRQQRRAHQRGQKSDQLRGVARYKSRAMRQERDANHLAQLFNIAEGLVPASAPVRFRAQEAINARVLAVVQADRIRYDKEIEARQRDRRLPAPRPVIEHEAVRVELRLLAMKARTTTPAYTASARRKARRAAARAVPA